MSAAGAASGRRAVGETRALPPIEPVAARTWSVPVPVPDLPIRYTLAYLLRGDDGAVLVDPGWDSPAGQDRLSEGLACAGLTAADLTAVVVTHAHRDHLGLAAWLRASGAGPVLLSPAEHAASGARTAHEYRVLEDAYLAGLGVPAAERTELLLPQEAVASIVASPGGDGPLTDGDLLPLTGRRVSVLTTPGHSPGSVCLWDEDLHLLVTGDTLLPRISPNVGLAMDGGPDPLDDYLRSLERLARLDGAGVLPGHEWRFSDARGRIAALQVHHAERLDETRRLLTDGPATSWQVARRLRWARPWHDLVGFQRRIATAEAGAHLARLVAIGDATAGEDGYAPR